MSVLHPERATGVLSNADAIASQTRATGFMNNRLDDDGVLRRVPLVIEHDGALHPNLSLATAMKALRVDRATIESDAFGPVLRVGPHRIPVDRPRLRDAALRRQAARSTRRSRPSTC